MKHYYELYKAQLENLREQIVLDIVRLIEKSGDRVIELKRPLMYEAVDDQTNKVVEAIYQDQTVAITYLGDVETTSFSELSVEFLISLLDAIESEGNSLISSK